MFYAVTYTARAPGNRTAKLAYGNLALTCGAAVSRVLYHT
jgi:hypothetical protein